MMRVAVCERACAQGRTGLLGAGDGIAYGTSTCVVAPPMKVT